jgi:hypothetical protein
MEVSEAKRLRALEEENSRLKRLVADQAVQIHILKEVNARLLLLSFRVMVRCSVWLFITPNCLP